MKKLALAIAAGFALWAPNLFAAIAIVGSPTLIASGANYTNPSCGSSDCVMLVSVTMKGGAGCNMSNAQYNSITRTPTVTNSDAGGEDRLGAGIAIFKQSELLFTASPITINWPCDVSLADVEVMVYTISGVDQSTTVRTSGSTTGSVAGGSPVSIAQTVTVGDFQVGNWTGRQTGNIVTVNNSWTTDFTGSHTGNGGPYGSAHFTAVGTSSPFSVTPADDTSFVTCTVALIPGSGPPPPSLGGAMFLVF